MDHGIGLRDSIDHGDRLNPFKSIDMLGSEAAMAIALLNELTIGGDGS